MRGPLVHTNEGNGWFPDPSQKDAQRKLEAATRRSRCRPCTGLVGALGAPPVATGAQVSPLQSDATVGSRHDDVTCNVPWSLAVSSRSFKPAFGSRSDACAWCVPMRLGASECVLNPYSVPCSGGDSPPGNTQEHTSRSVRVSKGGDFLDHWLRCVPCGVGACPRSGGSFRECVNHFVGALFFGFFGLTSSCAVQPSDRLYISQTK